MQTSVFVCQVSVMCFFNLITPTLLLPRKHRPLRISQKHSGYNRACFLIIRACKSFTQNININLHACVYFYSLFYLILSLYFRFGDLEDPQRMLFQTSSNPQGRFPSVSYSGGQVQQNGDQLAWLVCLVQPYHRLAQGLIHLFLKRNKLGDAKLKSQMNFCNISSGSPVLYNLYCFGMTFLIWRGPLGFEQQQLLSQGSLEHHLVGSSIRKLL